MIEGTLLGSHPLCGEVARAVVCPEAPWTMRLLSPVFRALSLEYIPAPLCERLGFRTQTRQTALWSLLDGILPIFRKITPTSLRYAPHYLRATRVAKNTS